MQFTIQGTHSRRHRRERFLAAALALAATIAVFASAAPARASRSDLSAFLERAERMSEHNKPVRADIVMHLPNGSKDEAVLIIDPSGNDLFFAVRSSGWRALMPLGWGKGKAVASAGGKLVTHGADDPLAGSDLRAMEFFAFWQTDYSTAFISDANRLEKTVTLYAEDEAPYTLFVITFDKEKLVPLAAKYYKDSMSNLVRLRRDSDHTMVGSRPRPSKIEITDFSENSQLKLELSWRTLDVVPAGLTSEGSFRDATVDWPGKTASGETASDDEDLALR